ncbi:MAG TPA: MurR/RpiR family transcriptional regulator [Devosiaceae bacterium]|nr:MurR/RpiR family transcriptional regulator [Devosiaceae bacterium]
MADDGSTTERSAFDHRVEQAVGRLTPAEQRMARFFVDQKQAVLLGSAAQIAELAGTSDATVVRTAKSLGFDGLSALREVLLSDLTGNTSPDKRLARTLEETGDDAAAALRHVIGLHEDVLGVLKRGDVAERFGRAVELMANANRCHVFGIGPSGAMAEYATLQFNRIGLPAAALTASGVALADRLLWLSAGDAVLMMAYAPLYREVSIVLDEAQRQGVPVILISDNLGPLVADRVAEILPVPRGKADHLAMHGGTMVLIEALIIGLAARRRDVALDSLERLSMLRGSIDKDWSKRGAKKK